MWHCGLPCYVHAGEMTAAPWKDVPANFVCGLSSWGPLASYLSEPHNLEWCNLVLSEESGLFTGGVLRYVSGHVVADI